ncbi:unnamed protein product [Lactuca saligna]|uniref:Uncharacterized protein n=1 Tax=Lactuca saligna TaxID=75948 RepID=A0AA35UY53_LACSI|nr:unnamed protein product [Lactuca saligna]
MDRIIELPDFLQDVGRIKHMCYTGGEEYGRESMDKEVSAGKFDPNVTSSTSIHTREMTDVIDSFVTYDYATLMKLGSLDINVLHQLCADDDSGGAGPNDAIKITSLYGEMVK